MRIRTGLCLLICCCAGLTACTAGAPKGPSTTVSTPSVGRPQPPSSAEVALSREAFTPYAALGLANNDGLAPSESSNTLTIACMSDAGYPSPGLVLFSVNNGPANLAFSQPWGVWGYLGVAGAEQYGFLAPFGSAMSALGIDIPTQENTNPTNLPVAERTAIGKCGTVVQDFSNTTTNGPLAGIQTLTNDIYNDIVRDAAVENATKAWSACMVRNGYSYHQPQTLYLQELHAAYGGTGPIGIGEPVSAAADRTQITAAVTDADCTQSTDLAGIYFAVRASYEQQLVNANQQALNAAVRQYKATYAKDLSKLPALLRTAKAVPFPTGKPSPTHS